MNVNKNKEGDVLTVSIEGILNINTAPELSKELKGELDDVKTLIFDLAGTEYTSSAGLRVLLDAFQTISKNEGKMTMINVNKSFYDILKLTGFTDFIDIRQE